MRLRKKAARIGRGDMLYTRKKDGRLRKEKNKSRKRKPRRKREMVCGAAKSTLSAKSILFLFGRKGVFHATEGFQLSSYDVGAFFRALYAILRLL